MTSADSAVRGPVRDWVEWWDTESVITPAVWRQNMDKFVRASAPLLCYGRDDVVLDIGSGPGYLADALKDRVKEIHCLDTSPRYLQLCRERFARDTNVFVHALDRESYTDLSVLGSRRFSIIVCQSVIQYYRSVSEVESLVCAVRRLAEPGARFLIADIPVTNQKGLLACRLLRTAWRDARLLEVSSFLFRMATSTCGKAYSSLGLLTLSRRDLIELVDRLSLDADVLDDTLTCNDERRHLLIRF